MTESKKTVRTCRHCKAEFFCKHADVMRGWAKFCSKACASASRAGKPRDDLRQQLARAERALGSAGWTYTEGAAEWKPPVGPSASPLLERIDKLELENTQLLRRLREIATSGPDSTVLGLKQLAMVDFNPETCPEAFLQQELAKVIAQRDALQHRWDYYQSFVKSHDATSITDMVVQRNRLRDQLAEMERLRDPKVLHINLCRGFPAKLSADQLLHIAGEQYQDMAGRIRELEAKHLTERAAYLQERDKCERLVIALDGMLEHEGTVDQTGIGEMESEALQLARRQAHATLAAVQSEPAPPAPEGDTCQYCRGKSNRVDDCENCSGTGVEPKWSAP